MNIHNNFLDIRTHSESLKKSCSAAIEAKIIVHNASVHTHSSLARYRKQQHGLCNVNANSNGYKSTV